MASKLESQLTDLRVSWHTVQIEEEALDRGLTAFPIEPVRALDGIHLGTALHLRDAFGVTTIASCDDRIRANAKALGFDLIP
jgi:hypothetical protein